MTGDMDDERHRLRTVWREPKPPGHRANLIVPRDVPGYDRMVERAKTGDPAEWKWHERGIMVALSWWQP